MITFGITPAQGILQKAVYDNISDLEGVLNLNDILMLRIGKTMVEYTAYDRKFKIPRTGNTSNLLQSEPVLNFGVFHGTYITNNRVIC